MAVIGSVIIDQIIFREVVEKAQISNLQAEVNNILPVKTKELDLHGCLDYVFSLPDVN